MRVVSWVVVIVSVGWLLTFNLHPVVNLTLPAVNLEEVSGTVMAHPEHDVPADPFEFATLYTQAWNSHDPARVASFYAPDGSITINGGDPWIGREGLEAMAESFMTTFTDIELTMDALEEKDERFIYHWTFTGTHAETGQGVRISGSETWRLDSRGLISKSVGRYDAAEFDRQVAYGISP